jgi:uncharacterized phage infection (PIP) family protein YhgE
MTRSVKLRCSLNRRTLDLADDGGTMSTLTTTVTFLRTVLSVRLMRLRAASRDKDTGASAVELAIITAVILGIAAALLLVIKNFVTTESAQIHG